MSPVPMITRVRLKNYRSITECDVQLGPLTILVGPNGSGKSNFLDALHFLADALNVGLDSAIRARGGIGSMMARWTTDDARARLSIEVTLSLDSDRQGIYSGLHQV